MKLAVSLVVCALAALTGRAEVPADPRAQALALQKYPQLAEIGSPFHKRFLQLVGEARSKQSLILNDAQWPVRIADLVAGEFKIASEEDAAREQRIAKLKSALRTIKEVETDLVAFAGRPIVISGSADIDNYYNYAFRDASSDWLCFRLRDGTGTAYGYMKREEAAGLRSQILTAGGPVRGTFTLAYTTEVLDRNQSQLLAVLLRADPPLSRDSD